VHEHPSDALFFSSFFFSSFFFFFFFFFFFVVVVVVRIVVVVHLDRLTERGIRRMETKAPLIPAMERLQASDTVVFRQLTQYAEAFLPITQQNKYVVSAAPEGVRARTGHSERGWSPTGTDLRSLGAFLFGYEVRPIPPLGTGQHTHTHTHTHTTLRHTALFDATSPPRAAGSS